jgi:hypothetical protein
MLVRYPDGSVELAELDIVGSPKAPQPKRSKPSPPASRRRAVPKQPKSDAVLFGEVAAARRTRSARWEIQRWVSLDDAAKRLDMHPDDLASGLIGRAEMRSVGDGLEVDRSELDAVVPELLRSGLLRSKPTPTIDAKPTSAPTFCTAQAKRKPRKELVRRESVLAA